MTYQFSDWPASGGSVAIPAARSNDRQEDQTVHLSLREAFPFAVFDRRGMLVDANAAFLDIMGYALEDVWGSSHQQFTWSTSGATDSFPDIWDRLVAGSPVVGEFARRGRDGRFIWLQGRYTLQRDTADEPHLVLLTGLDVTDRQGERVELQGQVSAIRRTMLHAEFGLEGHLLNANEMFLEAFGYTASELVGSHHSIFVSPAYAQTAEYAQFWSSLRQGVAASARARRVGKDGREVWIDAHYLPILDASGLPCKVVTYARDLTLQKRIEQARIAEAAFAADHDSLTGLYNRAALARRLQENSLRFGAAGMVDVVMMIDLDGFKLINDAYGHQAGDSMLWVLAQRIKNCLRDHDFVARLGGDEFAVLMTLSADKLASLEIIAARILDCLSEPIAFQSERFSASASIGIAVKDDVVIDRSSIGDELLGFADAALYEAKLAGKNTFRFFDRSLQTKLERRQLIERELDIAIQNRAIALHYQPIVSLSDGSVAGYEALGRWIHPVLGAVSPAEFIPIAEMTGQIHQLGQSLLHQAMHFASRLGPQRWIAINLSAQQLQREMLAETIIALAAEYGVATEQIEIEITETSVLSESPVTMGNLRKLKDAGFGLSLDDFGTGYSSLSHLLLLSFDRIKIDRSFAADCLVSYEKACIVDAVLGLGQALGISTIAEGVETQEVADNLRARGCSYAQGWLFGRPVPPEIVLGQGAGEALQKAQG